MTKLTKLTDILADKTLSFGCVLKHPTHKGRWIITEIKEGKYVYTRDFEANKGIMFTNEMIEYDGGVKIIGHPVTLARIMFKSNYLNKPIYIDNYEYGEAVINDGDGNLCNWNLEKDTLDQQSPETINYLAELFL